MGIGPKIKEYRLKNGFTQKDLADKLSVTYQAVSRWENDEVEPSFDTLNQMATLFNCSLDDLFNRTIQTQVEEPIEVVEETKQNEVKQFLGLCENCNRPIYEVSDIRRFDEVKHTVSTNTTIPRMFCKECYQKKLDNEKEAKRIERSNHMNSCKKRRIHSYIWSSLVALIIIAIAIFTKATNFVPYIVAAVMGFTFTSCMILFNTFIPDMWVDICGWGIKLPGVIFTLDLDGILFLIFVKLLGALLSFIVSILSFLFATALSAFLSVFVYPFSLVRNFKGIDSD